MARSRDHSEVEYWRGKVKELSAEVKRLKREVKRMSNSAQRYEEWADDIAELEEDQITLPVQEKQHKCPKCHNAVLDKIDIGLRILIKCLECDYRRAEKKK